VLATKQQCETEFEPRKGGSPQRFCHSKCRDAFHSAGRRWAEQAVVSGHLSVAELRNGPTEACTLRTREERAAQECHPAAPEVWIEEPMLTEVQRGSARDLMLGMIPINAHGLIELCRLGWLNPDKLRNTKAAAEAVVDLTNAAISLGLASTALHDNCGLPER
jgi:hypothetical protein